MANSLGTLTLDLVARVGGFTGPLDKASRESQKRMAEIKKSAEAAGKAIGYIGTAAAAGLAALTVDTVRTANEITRLSAVANSSTEEFQRYAAAASAVGIEQDKLADIFKDVNDKVGDFMQTGGGALADFFENIAPQVGVTADQFKKLSGPEALGLYVSSLEKAGASQQEMTFYLEAIASDATALLPLLENNAEGFKTLGEAAAQAGAILDEDAIRAANELAAVSFLADQALTGMKNQIISGLLPALSDLASEFVDLSADGETFEQVGEDIASVLKGIVAGAVGAYTSFQLAGKGLAGLAFIASEVPNGLDAVKAAMSQVGDELDETAQKGAAAIEKILSAGDGEGTNPRVELLATVIEASNEATARSGVVLKKLTKEQESAAKALQNRFSTTETGYERQIALINTEVDKRKNATEVAELQFEIESGKLKGINALQQERLNTLAAELDRLKSLKQANEDAAKAAAYLASLNQENSTAAAGFDIDLAGAGAGAKYRARLQEILQIRESFNEKLSELTEQRNSGEISQDLFNQETELLREALNERLAIQEGYYERLDEAQSDWMNGVQDAFINYVDVAHNSAQMAADAVTNILGSATDSLSDSMINVLSRTESVGDELANLATTIGQTIVQAITDMAAQWLVAQAIQLAFGKTTQASAAAALSANAQATALQAGIAAFASTAAIPIVGPALAPGAMAAALGITEPIAAAVATTALAGMAHDGIDSVPQDGTWLLQKGERVTTSETSAKLDNTLDQVNKNMEKPQSGAPVVNLYEDRSRAGQTSTRMQDDKYIIDVVVADLMGDGRSSKAIGQSFGSRRVGR